MQKLVMTALVFALVSVSNVASARLAVGDRAPDFMLPNMLGKNVSSDAYRGRPAVLVVGTAHEAAHACREWMLTLHKNYEDTPTVTYQVIVLNNPWFIPNFAVIDQLEDFIPAFGHPLVLLEWKTAWGELYGIPYDPHPRVIVIDKKGVIRMWHQGEMNDEALVAVMNKVEELS